MSDCLFCHIEQSRVIATNDLAYAIRDSYWQYIEANLLTDDYKSQCELRSECGCRQHP